MIEESPPRRGVQDLEPAHGVSIGDVTPGQLPGCRPLLVNHLVFRPTAEDAGVPVYAHKPAALRARRRVPRKEQR